MWAQRLRHPLSESHYLGIIMAIGAVAAAVIFTVNSHDGPPVFLDLEVYMAGVRRLATGGELYRHEEGQLPFTYPPAGAYAMLPLWLIPESVRSFVLFAANFAILARIAIIINRFVTGTRTLPAAALAVPVLIASPLSSSLRFGQVNVVLLWLACEGFFAARHRGPVAGLLLGLSAAIKLTPLYLLGVMFWSRLTRLSFWGAAGFVAITAAAAAAGPKAAALFWGELVTDPSRVGGLEYVSNQSINGILWRLAGAEPPRVVWIVCSVIVTVAVVVVGRMLVGRGRELEAFAVASAGMLLVSPVSWMHHWVWLAPAMLSLIYVLVRSADTFTGIMLGSAVLVFTVFQLEYLPNADHREWEYTPIQHVLGACYALWSVAYIAWAARQNPK